MKRQACHEGGWFDLEAAIEYLEVARVTNAARPVVATNSTEDHETLYRTVKGHWVLCHWSALDHGTRHYTSYGSELAAEWLVKNHYASVKGFPGHDEPVEI